MQPTTTSAGALSQLQQTESQAQDPNTILANQQQQLGVTGAQQTVTGLRGAINNTTKMLQQVAPGVMGRTANSLVTNAQASKQIQNESAPIQSSLTQEGTDYNQADQDLQNLQTQAQTAASGIYQGQQDKESYLQNLYSSLYGQEKDAADAAEAKREFDTTEADKTAAASSGGFNLGGTAAGASGSAQLQQRTDKGFNFQAANGAASNAVGYSQAKGIPIRTLLQNMANAGDAGAKTALNYVGNDYGVNVPKLKNLEVSPSTYNSTVSLLRSLGFKV